MTNHLNKFRSDAKKWLEMYDINENHSTDFYYEEYDKLISWVYQRTLNSGHLIGGPHLSFFRRDDKIRIVWDTQYFLENGTRLWTASDGSIEISYSDFVKKIKIFGSAFFTEMAKQVDQAIAKDWGQVHIDKQRLREEHQERENEFTSNFELLEQEPTDKTDWGEILLVYNRMKSDLLK